MTFDPALLMLPMFVAGLLAILCVTVVCVVALGRAHRADTVAVVRALPELVTAFVRRWRR